MSASIGPPAGLFCLAGPLTIAVPWLAVTVIAELCGVGSGRYLTERTVPASLAAPPPPPLSTVSSSLPELLLLKLGESVMSPGLEQRNLYPLVGWPETPCRAKDWLTGPGTCLCVLCQARLPLVTCRPSQPASLPPQSPAILLLAPYRPPTRHQSYLCAQFWTPAFPSQPPNHSLLHHWVAFV